MCIRDSTGTVFIDANASGSLDTGEAGLGGVTVTLHDGLGALVGTLTTQPDGSYSFSDLPAGDYSIVETQPTGYGSSTPDTIPVTLPLTGLTDQNFGETTSSIAGSVYVDANTDGVGRLRNCSPSILSHGSVLIDSPR